MGPSEHDQREPLQKGMAHAGRSSGRAGIWSDHTGTWPPRKVPLGSGHNCSRRCVLGRNKVHATHSRSLDKIKAAPLAWYAEDPTGAQSLEAPHNDICRCRHRFFLTVCVAHVVPCAPEDVRTFRGDWVRRPWRRSRQRGELAPRVSRTIGTAKRWDRGTELRPLHRPRYRARCSARTS